MLITWVIFLFLHLNTSKCQNQTIISIYKISVAVTNLICLKYNTIRIEKSKNRGDTMKSLNLNNIEPGEKAIIKEILLTGSIRRRLLDIGTVEHTEIECIGRSPLGDPTAFLIRGAVIAIRSEDCEKILIYPYNQR